MLEQRTFKDAVDADWALSRQYGITGVPTFVAGRFGVVGAQPYEALEELVRKAAASGGPKGRRCSPRLAAFLGRYPGVKVSTTS